jgi:hypothetical protein
MQFGEDTKVTYFSVAYTTIVGQMRCVPQVCYKMNDEIRGAVEKMAQDGLAKIYQEEVRFISGVAAPIKKPGTGQVISIPMLGVAVNHPGRRGGKTGGKGRREFV